MNVKRSLEYLMKHSNMWTGYYCLRPDIHDDDKFVSFNANAYNSAKICPKCLRMIMNDEIPKD